MRVLRAADYRRMAWKNGGGETAEIAVFPQGATMDDFGWRISMATVASDGPFSVFPGIDRTLTVLDGEGIVLDISGRGPETLTPASPPLSFPADAVTSARLVGGVVIDFNVMTRRGTFRHRVERFKVEGERELRLGEGVLFAVTAGLRIVGAGQETVIGRHDTVVLDRLENTLQLKGFCELLVVALEKL